VDTVVRAKIATAPADPEHLAQERRELDRVRAAYARRRQNIPREFYARISPFNLYSLHERETVMASLLRSAGLQSLAGLRILDVGCGRGDTLRQLLDFGAEPRFLFGVDLVEEHVEEARRLSPHIQITQGNATRLPFVDSSFDLIVVFTMFTSILDGDFKRAAATEICRVLAPGGMLLWYDFTYNNPRNPDVRGVGRAEIQRLFPGWTITLRRVTLAPPIGRAVAKFSPLLYMTLARLRILCTHYLAFMKKPG